VSLPSLGPRAVIFDWDNTLVDSWACIQAAMNATLAAMGHAQWDRNEMKRRVALSLRDAFPGLFGARWTEAREIFYQAFAAIHLDYLRPLPGAGEMLENLAAMGVKLSVVSNKNGSYLREEVQYLGWERFFERVVGATDAAEDKPATAPVVLALAACGLQPGELQPGEEVWLVGDATVDIECAVNSGCVPILMREEPERDGEFAIHRPRHRVAGCGELADLVRELLVPISPN
jgi:phosphoglycolate phosphatase